MLCTWVSHPEVIVDPTTRIQDWGLSAVGRARAARIASRFPQPLRIVSSSERKALDTAEMIAGQWRTEFEVDEDLGEMDRSATGYLDPSEFEPTVDAFFAEPQRSVRGWERAVDAQSRVERAVRRIAAQTPERGIAFIAHGGVGALLLASLRGSPSAVRSISPRWAAPSPSIRRTGWRCRRGSGVPGTEDRCCCSRTRQCAEGEGASPAPR